MVRLQLSIKAELENVTDLRPADPTNFEWVFDVKCNSCHEPHPKPVTLNRTESRELAHGKGSTANFVWKCSNCKRESSAKFEPASTPLAYTADHSETNQFAPLVILECRGLEFTGFHPQGVWRCSGVDSKAVFSDVDLSEGDWTDYDEKAKVPVGISNIESQWSRAL